MRIPSVVVCIVLKPLLFLALQGYAGKSCDEALSREAGCLLSGRTQLLAREVDGVGGGASAGRRHAAAARRRGRGHLQALRHRRRRRRQQLGISQVCMIVKMTTLSESLGSKPIFFFMEEENVWWVDRCDTFHYLHRRCAEEDSDVRATPSPDLPEDEITAEDQQKVVILRGEEWGRFLCPCSQFEIALLRPFLKMDGSLLMHGSGGGGAALQILS